MAPAGAGCSLGRIVSPWSPIRTLSRCSGGSPLANQRHTRWFGASPIRWTPPPSGVDRSLRKQVSPPNPIERRQPSTSVSRPPTLAPRQHTHQSECPNSERSDCPPRGKRHRIPKETTAFCLCSPLGAMRSSRSALHKPNGNRKPLACMCSTHFQLPPPRPHITFCPC